MHDAQRQASSKGRAKTMFKDLLAPLESCDNQARTPFFLSNVMNASDQTPDPLIGRILQQRYRVVERLSEGAMGVVYRGERLAIQRPVAIKFLHAAVAEQENLRRRFEVEARAMGRLSHPNCVSVIDFGVDDVPYVVMDFVDGRSLRDILNGGGMSASRALNVGRQLLTALVHAHAQGIIHRDIKPENMMLQQSAGLEDHVRVLDFGMAKITNHSAGLTAGFVLGTPNYMAPEQAQESDIDARADLYSAGIVIFELLTNRQPFAADSMGEILRRQLQMPAPALRAVMPSANFSAALEAVLLRAMAKQPTERFATAAAMLDALEAVPECRGATAAATMAAATTLPAQPQGRRLPPPPFKGKTPPLPATPDDATRLDLRAPSGAVAQAASAGGVAASAPAPQAVAKTPTPPTPSLAATPSPPPPAPSASDQLTMQLDGLDDLQPPLTLAGRAKQGAGTMLRRARGGAAAAWAWAADKSRRPYEIGAAAVMLLLIGVLLLSRGGTDDTGPRAAPAVAPGTAPERAAPAAAAGRSAEPADADKAEASPRARENAEAKPAQETPKPRTRTASRSSTNDSRWTQARSAPASKPAARGGDAPLRKATSAQRWGTHWGK